MKQTFLLVTFLAAAALTVNADPKPAPSLVIDCNGVDGCHGNIDFLFSGLDPSLTYSFSGVSSNSETIADTITPNADGTWDEFEAFLSGGSWEITLIENHKNGKPAHNNPVIDDTSLTVQ